MILLKMAQAAVHRWPATRPAARLLARIVRAFFPDALGPPPNARTPASQPSESQAEPVAEPRPQLEPTAVAGAEPQPAAPAPDRFDELWPALRADLDELREVAHVLNPSEAFQSIVRAGRQPPPAVLRGRLMRDALARMPRKVRHIVALPWLGFNGGSERVSQNLLRMLAEHYDEDECCVVAPEAIFDLPLSEQRRYGMPILAFNDLDTQMDSDTRLELFDRLMVQFRPATVHTVNSTVAWLAFRYRGAQYSRDTRLFGNVYSDIRIMEDIPVGAFWQYLPDTLDDMAGFVVDNRRVVERARATYALPHEDLARFHLTPTPVVGLRGNPQADMRPFRDPGVRRSLWMSRVAWEKRLDVLKNIAERCPDRSFHIYGDRQEKGSLPLDLSWIDAAHNVHRHGAFGILADIPFEQFDSFVFTTMAEGMPIAVLEAVAFGLPVVAPDVGGIGELIDEDTGWLVSGPDAVEEYIAALDEIRARPDEAQRRVAAAQARLAQRHSWENFRRSFHAIPGYLDTGRA